MGTPGPGPMPLDGRRPLAGRPLRSPQPRRLSRPRHGASRLSSIPAGFLGGAAWARVSVPGCFAKPRGTRAQAKGSFAMRGDGEDGPPRLRRLWAAFPRDKILPFPTLPPPVLVSFCFSFLGLVWGFFFPSPSPKGCLLFPSSFQPSR